MLAYNAGRAGTAGSTMRTGGLGTETLGHKSVLEKQRLGCVSFDSSMSFKPYLTERVILPNGM